MYCAMITDESRGINALYNCADKILLFIPVKYT